ncbi:MAG: SOS response-associated peptidase [Geoalkalibacter sp.]|uniref:SOS response-associated peptidase n=1 Tax=Geoalkalibacter sp. TaxID=3041440 RepID=UPI003D14F65F
MCGRFCLTLSPEQLARHFGLDPSALPFFEPSYNVAPSEQAPVLRIVNGKKELAVLRWGLAPSWAKDPAIGNRMINARAETAAQKPSFRSAFRHRRALLAIDGFYEWLRNEKGPKQPYFIHHADKKKPLTLAALWEHWEGETDQGRQAIETFTILTTDANERLSPIHDRMPVVVRQEDFSLWLDPAAETNELQNLLVPCPGETLDFYPVSTLVNRPDHKGPQCITPMEQKELF